LIKVQKHNSHSVPKGTFVLVRLKDKLSTQEVASFILGVVTRSDWMGLTVQKRNSKVTQYTGWFAIEAVYFAPLGSTLESLGLV
jgi:hypothetical protein